MADNHEIIERKKMDVASLNNQEEVITFLQSFSTQDINDVIDSFDGSDSNITLIIKIKKLITGYFDIKRQLCDDEIDRFSEKVTALTNRYKKNEKIIEQMKEWMEKRKNLITISNSSAKELDINFKVSTIGRLIGSSVELFNFINEAFLSGLRKSFTDQISSINPILGLVADSAFTSAPNLAYMGLVSSIQEVLWTKKILNPVVNAIKEDRESILPLQKWYEESREMNESMKKLFPFGIDMEIVKDVEAALADKDDELKIFASAFVSNVKKNPALFANGKFLSKVVLFGTTDVAKEWYKRMINYRNPSDFESAMQYFRSGLQEFRTSSNDAESIVKLGLFNMRTSMAPRFFLAGMNCISIYQSLLALSNGEKHNCSEMLRDLEENAKSFLNGMEIFKYRLEESNRRDSTIK